MNARYLPSSVKVGAKSAKGSGVTSTTDRSAAFTILMCRNGVGVRMIDSSHAESGEKARCVMCAFAPRTTSRTSPEAMSTNNKRLSRGIATRTVRRGGQGHDRPSAPEAMAVLPGSTSPTGATSRAPARM